MLVPLLALAVPLLDVSLAIMRRFLNKRPMFAADRGHIHHRLLDHGLTPRKAVLVLYGFAAIIAVVAVLLSSPLGKTYQNAIMLLILGIVLIGVRQLRYQEFQAAGQFLVGGEFQRRLRDKMRTDRLSAALALAATETDWWDILRAFAQEQGWIALIWDSPAGSHEFLTGEDAVASWECSIPLGDGRKLFIRGGVGEELTMDLPTLARILQVSFRDYRPLERSGFRVAS